MSKLFAIASLLAMASLPAQAATLTFDLNIDHCTGTCGILGSYGTATFTDVSGGLQVDVQLANNAAFQFAGNGLNVVSFSSSNTAVAGDFSFQNLGGAASLAPVIPAPNQDGFGDFLYAVDSTHPPNQSAQNAEIKFTVANLTVGSLIASTNGSPNTFVTVDIFGTNQKTGLVGGTLTQTGNQGETPIPGAIWLFGSVIAAAGLIRKRFI